MRKSLGVSLVLGMFYLSAADQAQADVNVLIIGSATPTSTPYNNHTVAPFNPTEIRNQLDSILSGAGLGTVNVTLLDYVSEHGNCLDVWFHYPTPYGIETTTRWPNLRGESGVDWDYVILVGSPSFMEFTPGVYSQGVAEIGEEVAKGGGETILLMPWPDSVTSERDVQHYKELVYRAGRTGGYKVAPAGLAWQADGSNPAVTPLSTRGAYICASSIYSRIWGQSAKNSTYTYNDTLADSVQTTVTANIGKKQYSGSKFDFQSPHLILGDKRRDIGVSENGTSTEWRYLLAIQAATQRARVNLDYETYSWKSPQEWPSYKPIPIAWDFSRSNANFNTNECQLGMNFIKLLNTYGWSAEGAVDSLLMRQWEDFSDCVYPGWPSLRKIPTATMLGQIADKYPNVHPVADGNGHPTSWVSDSIGTYMYTIYSGRCPLDPEPASGPNSTWYSQKVGYETAWRLGTCSTRAPGFKVMPSSATAVTVTPTTTETMTVQFIMQPRSDVTVTVSSSDTSAGIVGPQKLVFTPSNYKVPQTVTLTGVPGSLASAPFNVVFTTTSDDAAYDELSDSWEYTTIRSEATVARTDNGTSQHITPKNVGVRVNLNASGADAGNTFFADPSNGTLSWDGPDVIYTPTTDYVGSDGFAYYSLVGSKLTVGYIEIDVLDSYPAGAVHAEATDSTASEEGTTTGTLTIIREGATTSSLDVNFALSGSATFGDDYTLSKSSPVTIPAGSSSITITLTPVDDAVFGEVIETASLTITAGAGYNAISNPATISIADNDNTLPVVNAGSNQNVALVIEHSWTPVDVDTYVWYDASDLDTVKSSYHFAQEVGQLFDKSGNERHLNYEYNAAPRTGLRSINGLNVLDFDAAQKQSIHVSGGISGQPSNAIVIAVAAADSTSSGNMILNNQDRFGLGVNKIYCGKTGKGIRPGSDLGFATMMGTNITAAVLNWDASADLPLSYIRAYVNGTQRGDEKGYVQVVNGGNFGLMTGNNPDSTLDGAFAEAIITNADSSLETKQKLEGYLAHKWGLIAKLPADHPYKDVVPGTAQEPVVSVSLDGTVTDAEGWDSLTTTWSLVSGPGAAVSIGNATTIDTTATFTEPGIYVLRLTANDGYGSVYDDVTISVNAANALPVVSVSATDADASETGLDTGSFTISRSGSTTDSADVNFSLSGSATPTADYSLSASSPITIPAGQSSVVVTLTPVDDALKEDPETVTLSIETGSNYTSTSPPETITITDNDNTPPVVDAGPNRSTAFVVAMAPSAVITRSSDTVQGFGGTSVGYNSTNVSNWPANESPSNAIDGTTSTKYLNFGKTGTGFYVTPSAGLTTLTGVKVYTANDFVGRDPLSVSIEGARGGDLNQGSSWTLIASNLNLGINADPGRRTAGPLVEIAGSSTYTSYRVIVQSIRNGGENSVQYSEFQLYGSTGPFVTPTLNGTVTDADGETPTTAWTVASTNPAGLESTVAFADASAIDTTAYFTKAGTYVLRLTANDGYGPVYDDVTITVNASLPAYYTAWSSGGGFAHAFTDIGPDGNQDGDQMSNLMEFAFGTDPTLNDGGSVAADGSANGLPLAMKGAGDVMELVFIRRKDHDTTGSLSYTVEFSSDLGTFYSSLVTPTFVANSSVNSDYEVVKVAYPASLPSGQTGKFGRIKIEFVP